MRSAWSLLLALLLSGCLGGLAPDDAVGSESGPSSSSGPSTAAGSAGTTTSETGRTTYIANCHGSHEASWRDPGFAAAYPSLEPERKAQFVRWPGIDAGTGPQHPDWPLDGGLVRVEWRDGADSVRLWAPNEGSLAFELHADPYSSGQDREATARWFLEALRLQPEEARAGVVRDLAWNGSVIDTGATGAGEATQRYQSLTALRPGVANASAAALIPDALQNRTRLKTWVPTEISFSHAMADGDWTLGVILPTLELDLPGEGSFVARGHMTIDSAGHAAAWQEHRGTNDTQFQESITAAMRDAGFPDPTFADWTPGLC